jgi:hypothetical protein
MYRLHRGLKVAEHMSALLISKAPSLIPMRAFCKSAGLGLGWRNLCPPVEELAGREHWSRLEVILDLLKRIVLCCSPLGVEGARSAQTVLAVGQEKGQSRS